MQVSVDPGCQKEVKHLLEEKRVNYKITINDLQKLIRSPDSLTLQHTNHNLTRGMLGTLY